ncbi:hypothetical protein J8I26_21510 [Herbaspirillum sp. LeCh32-8]|uniref:3-hydroxyacyl-ACP dehydratase FabZ family protein n=1 Tax=Herbaspirillum sp. LeCh32-8 TaxID=2821356 RepID=UPI001AE268A6|nr:FabA/FabZ family ACP-dehydratase [Herbaspirillum sp. LeCh32-8]MBP0600705.1 hypothetical protein [Herbaspirillum sp. LeCh32-8]
MPLTKLDLERILDITDPFLMIDAVPELTPGKTCHAQLSVAPDEWFMTCHLTRSPVMPGVLQAEVMLQAFALPVLTDAGHEGLQSYLRNFELALYKKVERRAAPFILDANATITDARRGIYKGTAELRLEGELVAALKVTMVSPHAMAAPRAAS